MATTEIEKLERRYAENPQGLTFAPLAEVHRKNGDIPRALELLKSGLELHPNYIPASIVLGRCHLDQGDLPAAESAFSHVLRLDDENVIALKSLAEISERLGRTSEAQRWLKRLISIDRSNEEARQHLARLEGSKSEPAAPAVIPSEPPAPAAPVAAMTPSPAAPMTPLPVAEQPKEEPRIEEPAPLDLTTAIAEPSGMAKSDDPDQASSSSPPLDFLDTSAPPRPAEAASQIAQPSSIREEEHHPAPVDGLISQEFVPPKEGGYRLHPELTQEFGAADAPEQLEVDKAAEVELQSSGAAEFRVPNAAEDFMEASRAPELPDLTIEPPPPPPALVSPTATPIPARPSYSARETGGQSVAAFFQSMLRARPPGTPAVTSAVEIRQDGRSPAPAAQDAQTAGDSSKPTPSTAPAVPAAAPSQDAAVSFDDFFGGAAGGSGASQSTEEAGKDDLDQFQSWLQNLKR